MGSWTYGYDPNGNLTSQTGDNGSRIIFSYDAIKRITLYVVWGPTWPPVTASHRKLMVSG